MLSCINNLKVNFRYLLNTINDGSAVFSRGTLKGRACWKPARGCLWDGSKTPELYPSSLAPALDVVYACPTADCDVKVSYTKCLSGRGIRMLGKKRCILEDRNSWVQHWGASMVDWLADWCPSTYLFWRTPHIAKLKGDPLGWKYRWQQSMSVSLCG